MNLTKELNNYFGLQVKDAQDFKQKFKKEFLPHAQSENLLNFLLNLERKINSRDNLND